MRDPRCARSCKSLPDRSKSHEARKPHRHNGVEQALPQARAPDATTGGLWRAEEVEVRRGTKVVVTPTGTSPQIWDDRTLPEPRGAITEIPRNTVLRAGARRCSYR